MVDDIVLAGLQADGVTVFARQRHLTLTAEPEPNLYKLAYPYFKLTHFQHFDWLVERLAACLHPPTPPVWSSILASTREPITFPAWITSISMHGPDIMGSVTFSFTLHAAWEPPTHGRPPYRPFYSSIYTLRKCHSPIRRNHHTQG